MSRPATQRIAAIRWLTFLMFMMFAMTTDSVGVIIPQIVREFALSMKAASAFHYATMAALALSGILLGFLADRLGRKPTIVIGLSLFALNSYLFVFSDRFAIFLVLLVVSGTAIGIFKSGALALIGDISTSTTQHTATMNLIEGFFGVGAIIGPGIVAGLIHAGVSWKWLYSIAGTICALLLLLALMIRYPATVRSTQEPVTLARTMRMLGNPYALAFGVAILLYVAVEAAVYVWAPTYLADYHGDWPGLAAYAVSVFFVLRAAGRFLGAWLLSRFDWSRALALLSLAILICMSGSAFGGPAVAALLLPLSGLFMSVLYPTLNSKGISCFPKVEHGAVAGVILFFTSLGAVLGPLAMAALIDSTGQPRSAFLLAAGFAALLSAGLVWNWLRKPTLAVLSQWDAREYGAGASAH